MPARTTAPLGAPEVPVYFSNPDMLWANEAPGARLGQGAFAACLQSLHREVWSPCPLCAGPEP